MKKKVYFIGIGGIGMSALAQLAHFYGWNVAGSDLKSEELTSLLAIDIKVYQGHSQEFIAEFSPEVVVISSAIKEDNPELRWAKQHQVQVLKRAQFLHLLTSNKKQLAVSGTHGKTTTSAFLGEALLKLGYDPLIFVGGICQGFNSNLYLGEGEFFVLEADESDGTLTHFEPYAAIITNIEEDHLDYYRDFNHIIDTFYLFAQKVKKVFVLNADNDGCCLLKERAKDLSIKIVTYGINDKEADYCAFDIKAFSKKGFSFNLKYPEGYINEIYLPLLGIHNLSNALAVISLLYELSLVSADEILKLGDSFHGVKRRFEQIGEWKGAILIDDYAHHPTEVERVLAMIEEHYGKSYARKKVRIIFQPHRYSRWKNFYREFGEVFNRHFFKELILAPIYGAYENVGEKIGTEMVLGSLSSKNKVKIFPDLDSIEAYLKGKDEVEGELWVFLGAGDINKIPYSLANLK